MAQTSITLRRSPFVMLKQIIILEIAISFIYLIPLEIRETSNFYFMIAMIAAQIILLCLVFIRWYLTIYTIQPNKIVIVQNFITRKEENFKLDKIASITLTQGLFDKMFNTARLVAKDSASNILFILKNISEPAYNLSLIEQIQEKKKPEKQETCEEQTIKEIIKNGENQCVEFKGSFLWDEKKKIVNKELQQSVMKTITGFMNTQGGMLIIGVNDKKEVCGLENDLKNVKKRNTDGFENFFNLIFTNMIGLEFRHYIDISFEKINKKDLCIIKVKASSKPVYLKDQKSEHFYIRAGNATHPLRISEATRYIEENFKKEKVD